jgi:protein TonB
LMKGSLNYGWAILAALLLHGALALVLNATVRFRAPEPPEEARPVSIQLLVLAPTKTENRGLQVLQPLAKPTAVLKPAVVAEPVAEGMKTTEPATVPAPEPQAQSSHLADEAAGELNASASETETLEREASIGTSANGALSAEFSSPVGSLDMVLEARPLSAIDPLFPIGSRIRGEQGDVRIQVWITAYGKLEKIQILQTSGYPALDEAAERALRKTRFAPRKVNGNAVPGTLTFMVRFQLDR